MLLELLTLLNDCLRPEARCNHGAHGSRPEGALRVQALQAKGSGGGNALRSPQTLRRAASGRNGRAIRCVGLLKLRAEDLEAWLLRRRPTEEGPTPRCIQR